MIQKQEAWRRTLLRTEETALKYESAQTETESGSAIGCRLCDDPATIQDFKHWRLVPNAFPYDRYFSKSDMLVSKRHVDELGLSEVEKVELLKLKSEVLTNQYDIILENLPKQKSIPHHIHYHLVEIKRPDSASL